MKLPVLPLLAAGLSSLSAAPNLLTENTSFEVGGGYQGGVGTFTGINGWRVVGFGNGSFPIVGVSSDQPAVTGRNGNALAYCWNGSFETIAASRATVSPGRSYRLTIFAESDIPSAPPATFGPPATVEIAIKWYASSSGYTPLAVSSTTVNIPDASAMQLFRLTATAPTGATRASASVSTSSGEGILLDNVWLELASSPPPLPSAGPFRDAWLQPFSSDSIWNTPIGIGAIYEPVNINGRAYIAGASQAYIDVEYNLLPPVNEPVRDLFQASGFLPRTSHTLFQLGRLRLPDDFVLPDAVPGDTPNNCTSLVAPDRRTVWQFNALARPAAGGTVWAYEREPQDLYGAGTYGGHAGSGLSGLGGSVRRGELVGGGEIQHALKLVIWARVFLHYSEAVPGFRWPAYTADSYAGDPANGNSYTGTNPKLVMGTLLAIPPSASAASLNLTTPWGAKLFRALQNYGAYIVDDTAFDTTLLAVEGGVEAEFTAAYGDNLHNSAGYRNELKKLIEALRIVDNNTPATIGGPGARRVPPPPPLAPFNPADSNALDRTQIYFGGDLGGTDVLRDGDLATYVTTDVNQNAGQRYLSVDLGAARTFDRIVLDTGPAAPDYYLRNFILWTSATGAFGNFVNGGSYRALQALGDGRTHIRFNYPITTRYLTIQSTDFNTFDAVPWRLAEVNFHYDNDPAATPTALQLWRAAAFGIADNTGLAADLLDPDADGLNTLLEFALGGNPAAPEPGTAPQISVNIPANALALTFRRERANLDYRVEASSDLVTWTLIALNPGAAGQMVTVLDPVTLAAQPRRFLRLNVTSPAIP